MKTTTLLSAVFAVSLAASAEDVLHADLRKELLSMRDEDQAARRGGIDVSRARRVSTEHVSRLKAIISEIGWPTDSLVGPDGSQAAWLVVQHADEDPAFQAKVLDLLKPLALARKISPSHYAYLYDRTHEPQRFGTQGTCAGAGKWVPREIEDPKGLEDRRREFGLQPMEGYLPEVSKLCR